MNHSRLYVNYMKSEEWQQKRKDRLLIDNYECCMCGRTTRLECHHVTYKRLGREDVRTDLATLCHDCHVRLHRFYSRKR